MFAFFRRMTKNGFAMLLFGIVILAFIFTGALGGFSRFGGSGSSDKDGGTIAKIGKRKLSASEAYDYIRRDYLAVRQQNASIDAMTFVASGGIGKAISGYIAAKSMSEWAKNNGIGVSQKMVDGEIASIPVFIGANGKFDQKLFDAVLAQQHMTADQLRSDIAEDMVRRQILIPIVAGLKTPNAMAEPFARMLIQRHEGMILAIPTTVMPPSDKAPDDKAIADFYKSHIERYTLPEQRVIRYALVKPDEVKPTEAQIADYFKSHASEYAATEKRDLSQIILPDKAAAEALLAKIHGGLNFVAAAKTVGFSSEDIRLGALSKEQYSEKASPEAANAAFSLGDGAVSNVLHSPLGWHIVHVDKIERKPAATLDQMRGEITRQLSESLTSKAMTAKINRIQDNISNGNGFSDIAHKEKLEVVQTAPLRRDASDDQIVKSLVTPAFESGKNSEPFVATITADKLYALAMVDHVIAPAAQPLEKVKNQVVMDIRHSEMVEKSRKLADDLLKKAKSGVPFAQLAAQAGVKLPPVTPLAFRQLDLSRFQQSLPPAIIRFFELKPGEVALIPAPDESGWMLMKMERLVSSDPSKEAGLTAAVQNQFQNMMTGDIAEQFSNAVMQKSPAEIDQAAAVQLEKRFLSSGGSAAQ
ncbi:peptidyl-prolyl cis-trans isomerase D [Zymomonas mobilis]|uniref:peptidylprolyl isomerase n=1 Tax=Zymomonas mobilis TaxID=542 RepID=UPI000B373362|nr:peptidylprolyl isomerase [Zymomonas mobilis]ART93277.1 peptidylprolyl isomerase [Zymomonas mobilis subsp. mobilis]TWD59958.1 peptidyl-prolyl cis-trans isomerase D [Zymomonas mobilis]